MQYRLSTFTFRLCNNDRSFKQTTIADVLVRNSDNGLLFMVIMKGVFLSFGF